MPLTPAQLHQRTQRQPFLGQQPGQRASLILRPHRGPPGRLAAPRESGRAERYGIRCHNAGQYPFPIQSGRQNPAAASNSATPTATAAGHRLQPTRPTLPPCGTAAARPVSPLGEPCGAVRGDSTADGSAASEADAGEAGWKSGPLLAPPAPALLWVLRRARPCRSRICRARAAGCVLARCSAGDDGSARRV